MTNDVSIRYCCLDFAIFSSIDDDNELLSADGAQFASALLRLFMLWSCLYLRLHLRVDLNLK